MADDDPSGLATYAMAGARAGMVTGEGLASDCKLMRGQPGSGLSRVVVGRSNVALFGV